MNESKKELGREIPANLADAVARILDLYEDSGRLGDFNTWLKMPEREAIARAHHGIGQTMRNEWGLWEGSVLREDLKARGLFHADDMSSVIMTCLHRGANGKEWDVEGQVNYYQEYWKSIPDMEEKSMTMTNAVGEVFKVTTYTTKKKTRFDIAKGND